MFSDKNAGIVSAQWVGYSRPNLRNVQTLTTNETNQTKITECDSSEWFLFFVHGDRKATTTVWPRKTESTSTIQTQAKGEFQSDDMHDAIEHPRVLQNGHKIEHHRILEQAYNLHESHHFLLRTMECIKKEVHRKCRMRKNKIHDSDNGQVCVSICHKESHSIGYKDVLVHGTVYLWHQTQWFLQMCRIAK